MTAEEFASLQFLQTQLVDLYDSKGGGLLGASAAMRKILLSLPAVAAWDLWNRLTLVELREVGFVVAVDAHVDRAVEQYMSRRFGESAGDVDFAEFKHLLAWNAWCRLVLNIKRPKQRRAHSRAVH